MTLRLGQKLVDYIILDGQKNGFLKDMFVQIWMDRKEYRIGMHGQFLENVLFNIPDEELKRILDLPDSKIEELYSKK